MRTQTQTKRVLLHGAEADKLLRYFRTHDSLSIVEDAPDVVVSYGGDGTLLASELNWPGVPKVPILNSRRGHRCIPHPPKEVIEGLANGQLIEHSYTKIQCRIQDGGGKSSQSLVALNEFNVHMGRINSAVRFRLWLDGQLYENGDEILGDGLLISTPFGSTAYFSQITQGIFTAGIGIAFKATSVHVNHLVVPEETAVKVEITRGPAVLAFDSADVFVDLEMGDVIHVEKHPEGARILTCGPVKRLDEPF